MGKPDLDNIPPVDEVVKEYLESKRGGGYERTPGRYWAGETFSCPAKTYFKLNNREEETDLPLGVFERGIYAEDFIVKAYKAKYGDRFVEQVPVKLEVVPGITITGKVDGMVVDYNFEPIKILEFKSMAGPTRARSSPRLTHEAQALMYNRVFRPKLGSHVVYINTGDYADCRELPVDDSEEKWQEIALYWIQVHEQILNNAPLAEPYSDYECHFYRRQTRELVLCPFYQRCKVETPTGPKDPVPDSLKKYMPEGVEP